MDPLTIATAAASLVISASKMSAWLFELIGEVRNVDAKIFDLAKELRLQKTLLLSMEKTVRECQSQVFTLAHIDDNLWNQIRTTVTDSKATLDSLEALIGLISPENNETGESTFLTMLKKPGTLIQFKLHKREMSAFSDKVYKSNTAIQMALSVLHVSLTFRTNASQEDIFQELQILRELVEKAFEISHTNTQKTSDSTTTLQAKNLEGLVQLAKCFHTAASTTASTLHDLDERQSTWGGSLQDDLSKSTREHIERWNQLATLEESQTETIADLSFTKMSKETSPLPSHIANITSETSKYTNRHVQTVRGHTSIIRSVIFSPSGRILASGSDDATIRTWEVVKGGQLQQLQEIDELGGSVSHLIFSPDGESLSAIIGGSEFRVWRLNSSNQLLQTRKQTWGFSRALVIAFSSEGVLYTGHRDGKILQWVDSQRPIKIELNSPSGSGVIFISIEIVFGSPSEHRGVVCTTESITSTSYLMFGSEDGTIRIFSKLSYVHERNELWNLSFYQRPVMALTSIAMLPDQNHLVIGSDDRTVRCWSFRPWNLLKSSRKIKNGAQQTLPGNKSEVCCVAAAQSYKTTCIASGSEDHTIQLFKGKANNTPKFKLVDTLKGHSETVHSIAFSPNGRRLVSASADHTLRVWNLDD
ncbi:MAG: hypothetical protein M1829_005254 [Trizodia sp. TS-e1964]|nr:MAG: hypothetical protein M1829_005254 [Trizodia sp. TS-e1964]